MLLARIDDAKYFVYNIVAAVVALVLLFFVKGTLPMLVLIGLIGFLCSSIFPIIYSAAMKARPEKANEISGLMITGVSGGAVIPPCMGVLADLIGSQAGSLIVIGVCMAYLAFCAFFLRRLAS